jgi:hypothetical protein
MPSKLQVIDSTIQSSCCVTTTKRTVVEVTHQTDKVPVPPASVGAPLAQAKTAPLAFAKTERFDSTNDVLVAMQYKEKKMAPGVSGYKGEHDGQV